MTAFSVLLPVYAGDDAEHFIAAVRSVTAEQTLRPNELVVVCDGPVTDGVEDVLSSLGSTTAGVPFTVLRLARNVGLARALEEGLAACAHEVIARADADDISEPERFALEVPQLVEGDLDMVGSAIQEFDSAGKVGVVRQMPVSGDEIRAVASFRDPFNHPTVVYRKSAVLAAGGYEHLNKMEDYWLFVRMLHNGARVANLVEPLVRYRVDEGAYRRRGGMEMLISEWNLQRKMRSIGFIGPVTFARNVAVRCGYRLVPTSLRRRAYRATFTSED